MSTLPTVHPIERLRYVARAGDVPAELLVREAAGALAAFAAEPTELLTACRQLVRRRPRCGPLIWLAARMITGPDPVAEARGAVDSIERDCTPQELAAMIPESARVLVVGSPDLISRAVVSRPDVEVMVVDAAGDGFSLLRSLDTRDQRCIDVPDWGVAAAVTDCDLVLAEADSAGIDGAVVRSGSRAAAAVANSAGIDVWLVAGVGRFMPRAMWGQMMSHPMEHDPWLLDTERMPIDGADAVCTKSGLVSVAEAVSATDCPVAPELFR